VAREELAVTRPTRRFLRFYYPEFQRDYPAVYRDDAAFAAFIRLLALAETAWPATPELPRSIRPKPLRLLVENRLVKVAGHSFELRGFVKERTTRSENGRNAAAVRWDSDSSADAGADAMLERGRGREREQEAEQGAKTTTGRAPIGVVQPVRETA
jgi:hypothetical protein